MHVRQQCMWCSFVLHTQLHLYKNNEHWNTRTGWNQQGVKWPMMIAMIRMMMSRRKIGGNKVNELCYLHIFLSKVKPCDRWSPCAHHAHIGGIAPRVLNLDSSWKWVVSLTRRSLYTGDRSPWFCYPQNTRLRGFREPVWILGRRKDVTWFFWQSYQY